MSQVNFLNQVESIVRKLHFSSLWLAQKNLRMKELHLVSKEKKNSEYDFNKIEARFAERK